MQSASSLVILPFQDILGIDGRINTPGTVADNNWTYRFPVEIEEIGNNLQYKDTLDFYNEILLSSGRRAK
jgi:4-alpha-glucanotransferase